MLHTAPRLKYVPPKDLPASVDSTQDQPCSYKSQSGLALSQSLLGAVGPFAKAGYHLPQGRFSHGGKNPRQWPLGHSEA